MSPAHLYHKALKYFLLNNLWVRQIWYNLTLCKRCKFKLVQEAHFVSKAKETISSWFRVFERTTFSCLLPLVPVVSQHTPVTRPALPTQHRTDSNRIESVLSEERATLASATRCKYSLQPGPTQWTTHYLSNWNISAFYETLLRSLNIQVRIQSKLSWPTESHCIDK